MAIENGHRPDSAELPKVKITRKVRGSPKEPPALELQVNIEGRNHKALLLLDALEDHGLSRSGGGRGASPDFKGS